MKIKAVNLIMYKKKYIFFFCVQCCYAQKRNINKKNFWIQKFSTKSYNIHYSDNFLLY